MLLKLDERDHEILDAEPDEDDIELEAKTSWRERLALWAVAATQMLLKPPK